jgi:predicted RecA/RadA family phage recombinase
MKNFIQQGDNLTLTSPYDVASGGGFLVGSIFSVASAAAKSGEAVVGVTKGVFALAKATGEAWTVGAKLYWDNTNKRLTTTASSNTLVGVATAAAQSGDTSGNIKLGIVA